jgi:hypothetical protein
MIDREEYRAVVERELRRRCPLASRFELTITAPPAGNYVLVALPHEGEAIELAKFPNAWKKHFEADPKARKKVYNKVAAACTELERLAKKLKL